MARPRMRGQDTGPGSVARKSQKDQAFLERHKTRNFKKGGTVKTKGKK